MKKSRKPAGKPAAPRITDREQELLMLQMRHGLMMAKPPISLAAILDEFIESRKLDRAPGYIRRLRDARRHILEFFPKAENRRARIKRAWNAQTLAPADIDRYVAARMKKVANATINQEIAFMKAAFYLALQRQKVNHNPLARRRRLPVKKPSEVVRLPVQDDAATLAVVHDVLARGPAWLEPILQTLIATSERIGAVLALRVSDIGHGTIRFRPATLKTKQDGRLVNCAPRLAEVLAGITKNLPPDGFLFWARTQPPGAAMLSYHTVRHAWQDAAKRAGLERAPRLHDIRHFCTSTLDRHGVRETIIQAQLGHASNAMTRHYTHRQVRDTLPAARVLDAMVANLTTTKHQETAPKKEKKEMPATARRRPTKGK